MNYQNICDYLTSCGFAAELQEIDGVKHLVIHHVIEGKDYIFRHSLTDELTSLPSFFLHTEDKTEGLAHIIPIGNSTVSGICITANDSVSVNFELPHLAFEDSIQRHIELLEKAIKDPEWNKNELKREFSANWGLICSNKTPEFICASSNSSFELLEVFSPIQGKDTGIDSSYIGISDSSISLPEFSYIKHKISQDSRKSYGKGVILPLKDLQPPPKIRDSVREWYVNAIENHLSDEDRSKLKVFSKQRSKAFWVVFNARISSGETWFAVHLGAKEKKYLPLCKDTAKGWDVIPVKAMVFSRERILPRGGAETNLCDKKVLLVGCGSVGSEIAHKLCSTGLGNIDIADFDDLKWDNLYRHVLGSYSVGHNKAISLCFELPQKYPWINCEPLYKSKLLDFRNVENLKKYDLIIIAIGSPTHERLFAKYIEENSTSGLPPIINTWVEGYGIGGHAILDHPLSKGCFNCAYVDNNDYSRGLSSNLNFIERNQDVTQNHAGCGDLYLPYSYISAAQTALIASNLAFKVLTNSLEVSSKVSWKGEEISALSHDLYLTHRYYAFEDNLKILPLYHEGCDICNG